MNDMTNVTLQPSQSALPDSWIERIFQKMEDRYGSLWVDRYGQFPRERVKKSWAEDLAGFTGEELKRGLDVGKINKFPPSLPEFAASCRPSIDHETAYNEARHNLTLRDSGKPIAWTNKAVYWAYVAFGAYDMTSQGYIQARKRWDKLYNEMLAETNLPDIPKQEQKALVQPGEQSISRDEASKRVQEIGAIVGGQKDYRKWDKKILDSPENYPHISVKFAQEAMNAIPTAQL